VSKKTAFSKIFISISLAANVVACQSNLGQADQDDKPPSRQKNSQNSAAPLPKYPRLSQENAAEFLRQYGRKHPENHLDIQTDLGTITIELYDDTPLHRANMLYLTERAYFDGTWFYRVSRDHVIQAGNTDEASTQKKRQAIGDYTIPAEMGPHYHHRGAVAMVRSYSNNPQKRSDPYEFYIILGKTYNPAQLDAMAEQQDIVINAEQRDWYQKVGGAPHLDGEHTVFGRVVEGMAVVEAINRVKTDEGEWPLTNIPIQVRISAPKK